MPRSNPTLLRMAAIILPLGLIAFAARSALKPPKDVPVLSGAVPSAEELDSLKGYLVPQAVMGVPQIASSIGVPLDEPDPFTSANLVAPLDSASAALAALARRVAPRDRYVVTAILISSDNRVAVINETLVRIGSTLPGGYRVTAIENDHVEIVGSTGVRRVLAIRDDTGP